jgi:hypothetical protein
VGTVRSGDRPTGDTSATDQPATDAEVSGKPENDSASAPRTAAYPVSEPPADRSDEGQPADGHPAATASDAGQPAAGQPADGLPAGGGPDADQPGDGLPAAIPPAPDQPGDGLPAATPPAPDEPGDGLPAATPPAPDQPGTGEPAVSGAAVGQVTTAEPAAVAPAPAELKSLARLIPWRRRRRAGGRRSSARPAAKHAGVGGAAFARITVLPTILVVAWLLAGLPLLLAGVFLPVPALVIAALVAIAFIVSVRRVPESWPRVLSLSARSAGSAAPSPRPSGWPAWWGLVSTLVVAAGFAAWQFRYSSDSAIVLRDPGAYLQTGYWLAQHGSLPIPQSTSAFGGAHPGLSFASTGFLSTGGAIVPGVMSGLPLLLAAGFWVHGFTAGQAMGPIIGGLAVLAFGGLAGRLVGPRWAPAAALALALTLPEVYTSRGSFIEPATQVLLFGGLSLVVDALVLRRPAHDPKADTAPLPRVASGRFSGLAARLGWRLRHPGRWYTPQRVTLAVGGLALGLTALLRIDGLFDVLPGIVLAGALLARRMNAAAVAFCLGLAVGAGYGLLGGYFLARPLLASLRPLPELVGLLAACLALLSLAAVQLLRLPGFGRGVRSVFARWPLRWLPAFCGALVILALCGLAARPYLQTVRGPATGVVADYVASLQRLENLPVSPGRLYAEDTLYWVIWYAGLPAVLLGGFGAAVLLRRCLGPALSGRDPTGVARIWGLPLAIIFWGSAVVLWQPATVPDQPWASRRLVPLVIPGLILCAVWAAACLRDRARARGASRGAVSVVAAFCVLALLVPAAATTFGASVSYDSKIGSLQASADGLALKRTGQGGTAAVQALCSSIGPSASVVIVDAQVAQQFSQTIRGMCGVPVASVSGQDVAAVQNVVSGIDQVGRRPVLLGAKASELSDFGGSPVRVLDVVTTQDPHTLIQPPGAPGTVHYVIWMTQPLSSGTGV